MVATPTLSHDRYERAMAAVVGLLRERVAGRHATFFETGEGEEFPDGTESMAGYVIDADGQTFFFWTEWDADRGGPTFGTWEPVAASDDWLASEEYGSARALAGLDRGIA